MAKKILMIIAPKNFRDEEYFIPKNIFLEKHFKITTASLNTSIATGKLGGTTNVDIDINEINSKEYDALVLIGGSGAMIYSKNLILNKIINEFYRENKLTCAICIAPILLAESGVLKNKNATVWNGDKNQEIILQNNGATYINQNVVIDKNIITANGPEAAEEFGNAIVKYLN